jgi:hypothetical protein
MLHHARRIDDNIKKEKRRRTSKPTVFEEGARGHSGLDDRHAIMESVRTNMKKIDEIIKPRSGEQYIITDRVFATCTYFVYKDYVNTHAAEIRKYNGFVKTEKFKDKLPRGLLLSGPRRFGKSEIFSRIAAAIMMAVPNVVITCISNSANSAGKEMGILGKIRGFLERVYGVKKFMRDNDKHLMIRISDTDTREVHSFSPDAGDRLRGIGGNLTFTDDDISEIIFKDVVSPILALKHTSVVCSQTFGNGDQGIWSKMLDSRLFESYKVSFVCDECKMIGVDDFCKHRLYCVPDWISNGSDEA